MLREKVINSDLLILHILVLSWNKPYQGQNTSPWAWHCWTPDLDYFVVRISVNFFSLTSNLKLGQYGSPVQAIPHSSWMDLNVGWTQHSTNIYDVICFQFQSSLNSYISEFLHWNFPKETTCNSLNRRSKMKIHEHENPDNNIDKNILHFHIESKMVSQLTKNQSSWCNI